MRYHLGFAHPSQAFIPSHWNLQAFAWRPIHCPASPDGTRILLKVHPSASIKGTVCAGIIPYISHFTQLPAKLPWCSSARGTASCFLSSTEKLTTTDKAAENNPCTNFRLETRVRDHILQQIVLLFNYREQKTQQQKLQRRHKKHSSLWDTTQFIGVCNFRPRIMLETLIHKFGHISSSAMGMNSDWLLKGTVVTLRPNFYLTCRYKPTQLCVQQ